MQNLDQLTKALAIEMTVHTGELWRADITEHYNHLQSASACLSLSTHWNTKRLQVHSIPPPPIRGHGGETITAHPDRAPEAIARDICNRILTHARAHQIESVKSDQAQKLSDARKNLRLNMLRRYLPKEYQPGKLSNDKSDAGAIFAQETYSNLINLEMNLTLPEALQVLKFMQTLASHANPTRAASRLITRRKNPHHV